MNITVRTILLTLLVVLFSPQVAEASADSDGGFVKLIDIPCNKVALAYTPYIVDGMTVEEIKYEIKNAITLTVIPLNSCYYDIKAVQNSFLKNKELRLARGERNSIKLLTFKDDNSMSIQNIDNDEPDPPNASFDWELIDAELIENEYPQYCLKTIMTVYTWLAFENNEYILEYTIVSSVLQMTDCDRP